MCYQGKGRQWCGHAYIPVHVHMNTGTGHNMYHVLIKFKLLVFFFTQSQVLENRTAPPPLHPPLPSIYTPPPPGTYLFF